MQMAVQQVMKSMLQDLPATTLAVHKVVWRNGPSRQKNSRAKVLAALEREQPGTQVPMGTMPQVGGPGMSWV